MHLFLSIVTCGLWLVSWLAIAIGRRWHPWQCVQCGGQNPVFEKVEEAVPDRPPQEH